MIGLNDLCSMCDDDWPIRIVDVDSTPIRSNDVSSIIIDLEDDGWIRVTKVINKKRNQNCAAQGCLLFLWQ